MLRLVPMTPPEFDAYLERAVPEYAQAHLQAGDCEAGEALALAQADYASLLPQGLATEGHHLFTLRDGALSVGMIWFQARESRGRRSAYIFDFHVEPEHRRKGYARLAMRAIEEHVAPLGIGRINLNVMGHNVAARALYEQCGYTIAGIGMTKLLRR